MEALAALRKAGEAHIRMRVIKAFEPVAQSVEHVTFNHGVQGSNPCGLTIIAGNRGAPWPTEQ